MLLSMTLEVPIQNRLIDQWRLVVEMARGYKFPSLGEHVCFRWL